MNINKNITIIFGVSVLVIIIILGWNVYNQEGKPQDITPISYDTAYKGIALLEQNYPLSVAEANLLRQDCLSAATFIFKDLMKEQETKEILCTLTQDEEDLNLLDNYRSSFSNLREIPDFKQGQYITIAVNYSDLLKKNNFDISSENSFNLCTIINPRLRNPFREILLKDQININHNIVFSEGEVLCSKFFGPPDETANLLISGFVSQADLFEAKIYLVLEDEIVNNLFSQGSFTDIENILQSYLLLWEIEKSVI